MIFLEIWILYNGKKYGLFKVVREVYKNYEDIEFKIRVVKNKISDLDWYVKFVNIVGKEVKNYVIEWIKCDMFMIMIMIMVI